MRCLARMVRARAFRVAFAPLGLALALVLSSPSVAHADRIRIRGAAALEATAAADESGFELRGNVRDDAGRPLGPAHVRVRLAHATGNTLTRLPPATSCFPSPEVHQQRGFSDVSDEYVIDTDGAGAFCARFGAPDQLGALELQVAATRDYEGTSLRVTLDASRRAISLLFAPEPQALQLEQKAQLVAVDTRVVPPLPPVQHELPLVLSIAGRGSPSNPRELARTMVRAGELARFEFSSDLLGDPGPALLTVTYAGSTTLAANSRTLPLLKTARVRLSLPEKLPKVDAGSGFELVVNASSLRGAVNQGSVEVLINGAPVGAAPVIAGKARVVAEFETSETAPVPISVRYLPGAPWLLADRPLETQLAVAPRSPLRQLPWLMGALAVALWMARGWRRPPRLERPVERAPEPTGRASVEIVEVGADRSGWRGRVVDAHEGAAVARARVAVMSPTFVGDGVVATTETDADGAFALEFAEALRAEGIRLRVTAQWHATLERPLPPQGQFVVQLVSRRRALLDLLVSWARQRGRPWTDPIEPTPAQIAQVARSQANVAAERWALEVEQAAYGVAPPDETREQNIRQREPT